MKIRGLVSLLAALLMLLPLGVFAENEGTYELGLPNLISYPADEGSIVCATGSIKNISDKPLFVGYGSCDMFDKEGNLLCTASAQCVPMQLKPGETGIFRADVPSFTFSNPNAEVADFAFRFEPFPDDGPGYTLLSPDAALDTNLREYEGCPIIVTIHNNTGKDIEQFDVCVSLWHPSALDPNDEQILFMPESMLFYNRIPKDSSVDVKFYLPSALVKMLEEQWPDYRLHSLVAIPD